MNLKSFRQFNEELKKEVVFTFGRFNPPTTGHLKLLDKVASEATGKNYKVFASHSSDSKKNPLMYKEKIKWMRKLFPAHGRNIIEDKNVKNVFDILVKVYNEGFTSVKMVVGSDRVGEFKKLMMQYNGIKARHGFYEFPDGLEVVSAGERDPDADDVSGMSASKMRAAAADNDFNTFSKGLPKGFKDGMDLFNVLRNRMGIKESARPHVQLPFKSNIREKYIAGEIFQIGTKAIVKDEVIEIAECKSNYIVDTTGKKHFIHSLQERAYPDGEKIPEGLPSAYAKAKGDEKCSNCKHLMKNNFCHKWEAEVRGDYWCKAWEAK